MDRNEEVEVHEVNLDMQDHSRRPVVVNAENGSHVVVNVSVKNYGYPEWLDEEVRKHLKWEDEGE